jgi:predicted PurR-regulated permease PerM
MQRKHTNNRLPYIALLLLATGCLLVLWPFLTAILWAAILVSTSWPFFLTMNRWLGERRLLAAGLMTCLITLTLLAPITVVAMALADNIAELANMGAAVLENGLPDAPDWVTTLPLVGQVIHDYWQRFAHDGQQLVHLLEGVIEPAKKVAFDSGRLMAKGVLEMSLSVFLAFFFFLHGEALAKRLFISLQHFVGSRAIHLLEITHSTVTGVIYGILGTALAQGVLAATGFAIAGVPGAMVLGLATFFLSVVPIGPPLIWGGAAFWLFQQGQTNWAIFVVLWGFFIVSTVDNVIKPFIISRGAKLPFAIVFLGVLGGVLAFGVIGAFLGPTLLAIGYSLLLEWTSSEKNHTDNPDKPAA